MNERILLKEIPARTFHSAVCTTYSINLYYLEQQVLAFLSSKGINYVSILADSEMLSVQLEQHGHLSQPRKRHYSIQGIFSSGAFHSKIIFLAGDDSVLLLLGSGNLTSSGHGKNLEVWNPIFVESIENPQAGFVLQAWEYLKSLHNGLGTAALNKLTAIQDHCHVLSNSAKISKEEQYPLSNDTSISFVSSKSNRSIFQQVVNIIGAAPIDTITIMSPYHDIKGRFIQELKRQYSPKQVRVLLQKNFGNAPSIDPLPNDVSFYDWKEVLQKKVNHPHFHSKNIILSGPEKSFLISGSANASIAAFGTSDILSTNQECGILYESSELDFHELLELKFDANPISIKDYIETHQSFDSQESNSSRTAFIISAEQEGEDVSITVDVFEPTENADLTLFESQGVLAHAEKVTLDKGLQKFKCRIPKETSALSVQFLKDSVALSNSQFVTDLYAFESKNPSPNNRSLNQIRNSIENGNFNSLKIIDYYNTLSNSKSARTSIKSSSSSEEQGNMNSDPSPEELVYMSYDEIQRRAKFIPKTKYARAHTQYSGIQILDSINTYKRESRALALEAEIDEEETEDASSSQGRDKPDKKASRVPIKESSFKRNQKKASKYFDQYISILETKVNQTDMASPTLIDLSMYLIAMEVLLHLVDHTELIKKDGKDEEHDSHHLLSLPYSKSQSSWTEYMLRCIGLFSVWSSKSGGFQEIQSIDYQLKLERYKKQAFHTNLAILAIAILVNNTFDKPYLDSWIMQCLLNSMLIFNSNSLEAIDTEEVISSVPQSVIEDLGNEHLTRILKFNLTQLSNFDTDNEIVEEGGYYQHPKLGYTSVSKVLINSPRTFLKLFSLGFNWDPDSENYWNRKVYSVTENKWIKTIKSK